MFINLPLWLQILWNLQSKVKLKMSTQILSVINGYTSVNLPREPVIRKIMISLVKWNRLNLDTILRLISRLFYALQHSLFLVPGILIMRFSVLPSLVAGDHVAPTKQRLFSKHQIHFLASSNTILKYLGQFH